MTAKIAEKPRKVQQIKYQRPWLYAQQEKAFFCETRYSLIEATVKSGKTVGALAWLFERALLGKRNENRWWVAPVYPQAEIAFRRLKNGLNRETVEACNWNETSLRVQVPSGGFIWFKSGDKPDSLFGEDVFDVVMDEASRQREEAWHAVRSTLTATRGWARLIGNVKGRKNFFYALCRRAEGGEPEMAYHKIIAADAVKAGILKVEEIEQAKRDLPEAVFRELYLAEPSDDGGNPFGLEAIQRCVVPLSKQRPVARGIDLAKSVDFTVDIGLDASGIVSHFDRFRPKDLGMGMREAEARLAAGPICKALVDSTGLGDRILEELQQLMPNRVTGYKFHMASKQKLMEGLASAIQGRRVMFPEGEIPRELESFEYEYTRTGVHYTAPSGMYDDCVVALALAWQQYSHGGRYEREEETAPRRQAAFRASATSWMGI